MRVAFSMFDLDGDGQISVQEVQKTMLSLGIKISLKEVKQIVKRVDTDRKYTHIHTTTIDNSPTRRIEIICSS